MTAVIVLSQPFGGGAAIAGLLVDRGLPYAIQPVPESSLIEDAALRAVGPRRRAAGLVEREQLWGPDPWLHNDPAAIDTLDEWRLLLPSDLETRWIVVERHPTAIARSRERWDGQAYTLALQRADRRAMMLRRAATLPGAVRIDFAWASDHLVEVKQMLVDHVSGTRAQ